jgi:hypothetical protein
VAANAAPASRTRHISAESRCDSIASLLKTELWEGADFARGDEQRSDVLKPILCGGAVSMEQRMQRMQWVSLHVSRRPNKTDIPVT